MIDLYIVNVQVNDTLQNYSKNYAIVFNYLTIVHRYEPHWSICVDIGGPYTWNMNHNKNASGP